MKMVRMLPATQLEIFPLCLGGNVFGWSADEAESFKVLDAFVEAGGNMIDTADVYSEWAPGHVGGESETIIGKWMKSRNNRHQMVIATKVAKYSKRQGLSAENIHAAIDDSLRRLQTDHIDVYYAHEDDANVEQLETMRAFDSLVRAGKVHDVGASNFTGARLRSAHEICTSHDLVRFTALQNLYNLVARTEFESDAGPVAAELGIDSFPFFSLAIGFLTGKYQRDNKVETLRSAGASRYFTDKGWATLAKVEEIARNHGKSPSAVALAWLRAKNQTPIASARTVEQLKEIMQIVELSASEVAELDAVSK